MSSTTDNQIVTVKAINDTSVALTFSEKSKECNVEVSLNGVNWEAAVCNENVVSGLEPGRKYHFRLKNVASNKIEVTLPSINQTFLTSCSYKGKTYKIGKIFTHFLVVIHTVGNGCSSKSAKHAGKVPHELLTSEVEDNIVKCRMWDHCHFLD